MAREIYIYAGSFLTLALIILRLATPFLKWLRALSFTAKLPGPKQHLLLGNLPDVLKSGQIHHLFLKWIHQFGPVFTARFLGTPVRCTVCMCVGGGGVGGIRYWGQDLRKQMEAKP